MSSDPFFDYPSLDDSERAHDLVFLANKDEGEWATLLDHAETIRFAAGEVVARAGEADEALYLLTEGTLEAQHSSHPPRTIDAPAVLGEVPFLDGGPRTVTLVADGPGVILRLSAAAFEVLAAKDPALGREILADAGRILASRLRAVGDAHPSMLD